MSKPLYIAFYTRNTLYESEASRLRMSLDRHGLEYEVAGIESRGDWVANTRYTAEFIRRAMCCYPTRYVVYLNADAYVHKYPLLLDQNLDGDIAAHTRSNGEMLNGTLWISPDAFPAIERYCKLIADGHGGRDEQTMLRRAIQETGAKLVQLPPEYVWIHDIMEPCDPVIEHFQASRETNVSYRTQSRRNRLAELGL